MKMTQRLQSGFTLMEAMVALLIFSVGLLGLAGMQMSGLQNNHNSLRRTQAIQLAYDMADQLRSTAANPGSVDEVTWKSSLASSLPAGKGKITPVAGVAGAFRVTVMWDEDRTGASGTNCKVDDPTDLRCFEMTVVP